MIILVFSKPIIAQLQKNIVLSLKLNNIHLYRLSSALLWYSEGRGIKEIAALIGVCSKTVFNWIKSFMCKGFAWLNGLHYQGRGRKEKITQKQRELLYDLIVKGPEANGFSCGIWNSAMVNELIWRKFGVRYNLNYLPTLLKKIGLTYQKAKFVTDRKDEENHEASREKWINETFPAILAQAKKDNSVILFGDEVSFAMWGSLSRTWAPIGQQPTLKTKGIRKGLKMFGAIELQGGGFQYLQSLAYSLKPKSFRMLKEAGLPTELLEAIKHFKNRKYSTENSFMAALEEVVNVDLIVQYQPLLLKHSETSGKFNGESYIDFLKQLLNNYEGKIILIEDGAPYHGSKVVTAFKKANSGRLTVERLPAFSPDYNPIEKLWKNTKRDATHLKYFKTFECLYASVIDTFESYMNDARKIICVMKKLREDSGITA
ncbi:transposase [Gammaproteobacteria bacterium]